MGSVTCAWSAALARSPYSSSNDGSRPGSSEGLGSVQRLDTISGRKLVKASGAVGRVWWEEGVVCGGPWNIHAAVRLELREVVSQVNVSE